MYKLYGKIRFVGYGRVGQLLYILGLSAVQYDLRGPRVLEKLGL